MIADRREHRRRRRPRGDGHAPSARCLAEGGHRVLTSLAGRSEDTVARAARRRCSTDAGALEDLVRAVDVVLLVVPPGAARAAGDDLARRVRRAPAPGPWSSRWTPSPRHRPRPSPRGCRATSSTARSPARRPARTTPTPTRVFLSGPRAGEVAALGAPGVRWIVLDGPVGAASAAKMCTASVRKGYQALLAQACVTAEAHGVLDTVLADLRLDFPDAGVASGGDGGHQGVALRRRDDRDRRDAGGRRADRPRSPRRLAEAYRALATSGWGTRRPEEVPPRPRRPHRTPSAPWLGRRLRRNRPHSRSVTSKSTRVVTGRAPPCPEHPVSGCVLRPAEGQGPDAVEKFCSGGRPAHRVAHARTLSDAFPRLVGVREHARTAAEMTTSERHWRRSASGGCRTHPRTRRVKSCATDRHGGTRFPVLPQEWSTARVRFRAFVIRPPE